MSNDKYTYVDHLDEDPPIPGQKFVCMSFLSPEGIKNCNVRGVKVRAVCDTKEEADKKCEELRALDPYFHIFVGEVGKWLAWDPDVNTIEDHRYAEQQLNDIMKGYKENVDKSKKLQEQRKMDMIKNAAKFEQEKKNKKLDKDKFKEKIKNLKKNKKKNNKSSDNKHLKLNEKKLGKERALLNEEENLINKKKSELSDVETQLDNIKNLYNQLKNKN